MQRSSSGAWVLALTGLLLDVSGCTRAEGPTTESAPRSSGRESPPESPPERDPKPAAAEAREWDVVRVDPSTDAQTDLGRIRVAGGPPFAVELVDGGDELRALVADVSALGDFEYHGGSPVARASDPRWFEFLRREWFGDDRGLALRVASDKPDVSRWKLLTVTDGEQRSLGTVEIDDVGYLRIVDGPAEQRERLRGLVTELNRRDSEAVEIAPPEGEERGQWAKVIERGTPEFLALARRGLYDQAGALLVAEDRAHATEVTAVERRGLRVRVPAGLTEVEVEYPTILALSGPPGGVLGVRVVEYEDMPDEDAALLAKVAAVHGDAPGFVAGPATEVEIAGQRWRAASCQTGAGQARATHLIIAWSPSLDRIRDGQRGDDGYLVTLSLAGEREVAELLDHPLLATVVDSLG